VVKHHYLPVYKISPEDTSLIETAAYYTYGYPYLFQLLGYYMWENGKVELNRETLEQSFIEAKAELF
jgi:hypothetical protein